MLLPFACNTIEEPSIDPDPVEGQETGAGTHLVITANPSSVTKSTLNEDNSVSFVSTDTLSVFDSNNNNCVFTVKKLYADGSADFEGFVSNADGQMPVMYPYQKNSYVEKSGPAVKLYFSIPAEQRAVEGSYDPSATISLGTAEMTGDGIACTTLSNMCALVKFTMPKGNYSKVTLTADETQLCGKCNVNVNSSKTIMGMENGNTVSLNGAISGGKTYYLSVIPGTAYNGFTVRIYDANGDLAGERSTTKEVTFTMGKILNIGTLPTAGDSEKWLGEGTQSSPYIIASPKHLEMLADAFSLRETAEPYAGKYFKQTNDIDMGGKAITIGNYADRYQDTDPAWGVPTAFNANYDGGGHTISNYKLKFIYMSAIYVAGLFNCVSDATISNLNLKPALYDSGYLIDGLESTVRWYYIGFLTGEICGPCTITNCHSLEGDYVVTACDDYSIEPSQVVAFGGLAGYTVADVDQNIIFRNCTNEADLTIEKGTNMTTAGGLIGTNYGGGQYQYIDRCRNKGDITVSSKKAEVFAGGFIGRITDTNSQVVFRISNCVNEGTVTAVNEAAEYACAGGIAGSNDSDGNITDEPWVYNCLNKGDIHAECLDAMTSIGYDALAGGIFGYCYDSDTNLALCVNVGRITSAGDPHAAPICATGGHHMWCFWLMTDEFEGYEPASYYHCYPCIGFIEGTGSYAGTPEYVRLHGKAADDETGEDLYEKTEWSKSLWTLAASWKGQSDLYWSSPDHKNTLDLDF